MENNQLPPKPPGPPCRIMRTGWFGEYETKESKQRRHDYNMYMQGWWKDEFNNIKGNE